MITGVDGLVGSAVMSLEKDYPQFNFIPVSHKYYDLTDQDSVWGLFRDNKNIHAVLHLAASVGGIKKNLNDPVGQFEKNILMNTFLVKQAYKNKVEKFIGMGSVCAFPGDAELLTEENYLDDKPFDAHFSYAQSKRMMSVQLEAYKKQYNWNVCTLLPTNIFGTKDNYNLTDGHVMPMLIHKFYNAYHNGKQTVEIWGDGTSVREFVSAKDLAKICLDLMSLEQLPTRLIVPGKELSIMELTQKLMVAFHKIYPDWTPSCIFDDSKPSGQKKRPTSNKLFKKYFGKYEHANIDKAIEESCKWFCENFQTARK